MNIYEAIADIMKEGCAIGKSKFTPQQRFNYRGIDDVMNTFQPLLSQRGIFLVPEVLEHHREERTTKNGGNLIYSVLKVKYTFFATDGSSVSAVVIGEGMDSADKSSNKAMAAAMKYAMFQVFCIPTAEADDADSDKPEPETLYVDSTKITVLRDKLKQKGVKEEAILERYHCDSIEKLTVVDFMKAMSGLEKTPDAKAEPDVDFGI